MPFSYCYSRESFKFIKWADEPATRIAIDIMQELGDKLLSINACNGGCTADGTVDLTVCGKVVQFKNGEVLVIVNGGDVTECRVMSEETFHSKFNNQ